jgi:hypothetical protein
MGGYSVKDAVGIKCPSAPKAALCVLRRWVADDMLARREAKKITFAAAANANANATATITATATVVSSGPVLPPSRMLLVIGCRKGALLPLSKRSPL